jgi:hypothetical protein
VSQLFAYVATLIELIESKPCLWDKTSDICKDKIEKSEAWREFFFPMPPHVPYGLRGFPSHFFVAEV